jgi:hypothetical protein
VFVQVPCAQRLGAKAVQGAALAFESVDNIGGHDGLPLGVLRVGHSVTHDILQKHSQHCPNLNEIKEEIRLTKICTGNLCKFFVVNFE